MWHWAKNISRLYFKVTIICLKLLGTVIPPEKTQQMNFKIFTNCNWRSMSLIFVSAWSEPLQINLGQIFVASLQSCYRNHIKWVIFKVANLKFLNFFFKMSSTTRYPHPYWSFWSRMSRAIFLKAVPFLTRRCYDVIVGNFKGAFVQVWSMPRRTSF